VKFSLIIQAKIVKRFVPRLRVELRWPVLQTGALTTLATAARKSKVESPTLKTMTKANYTKKDYKTSNPQRKTITREKKIQLATAIMRLKRITNAELGDFAGVTRNTLIHRYNKVYGTNMKEEGEE
ncbi:MAG: hypothetical protein QG639_266, partial [Patescibacteria group bacterium]|nr:hypothetical protein [Patescibacteria group bacterium]